MTIGFDLGHDLDLEFSRSNIEFAISQPKMVRLPRNEKQTYRLNSRPQMWPMVWIYQIVTGVTSVVGVPSTHLVITMLSYKHSDNSDDWQLDWLSNTLLPLFMRGIHMVTCGFCSQRASNVDSISMWWCHHVPSLWKVSLTKFCYDIRCVGFGW